MSQVPLHDPPPDPIAEGARARALGRPKDACPYPVNSAARVAWLEGYDGLPATHRPGQPGHDT
ncbi:Rmf/CrpP family protein [Methylobacterium sp. NEAU K]|uniref:ribosome modulation factor n=1 Tax=Methylobacterium sp. NEAU K TaxID=3064946 RepID=UPI00273698DD|nr:Rmf/CrpP family protein [Methylobacterium sp. NEAU K]MDP4003192.1 Rmf/CrpP family protein [Methylobacterium sp. NEAU K]